MADDMIIFAILKQIKDNTDSFLEDSKENVKNVQELKNKVDKIYTLFEDINNQVVKNRELFDSDQLVKEDAISKLRKDVNGIVCEMKSHLKYQHNSKGVV